MSKQRSRTGTKVQVTEPIFDQALEPSDAAASAMHCGRTGHAAYPSVYRLPQPSFLGQKRFRIGYLIIKDSYIICLSSWDLRRSLTWAHPEESAIGSRRFSCQMRWAKRKPRAFLLTFQGSCMCAGRVNFVC